MFEWKNDCEPDGLIQEQKRHLNVNSENTVGERF